MTPVSVKLGYADELVEDALRNLIYAAMKRFVSIPDFLQLMQMAGT